MIIVLETKYSLWEVQDTGIWFIESCPPKLYNLTFFKIRNIVLLRKPHGFIIPKAPWVHYPVVGYEGTESKSEQYFS